MSKVISTFRKINLVPQETNDELFAYEPKTTAVLFGKARFQQELQILRLANGF